MTNFLNNLWDTISGIPQRFTNWWNGPPNGYQEFMPDVEPMPDAFATPINIPNVGPQPPRPHNLIEYDVQPPWQRPSENSYFPPSPNRPLSNKEQYAQDWGDLQRWENKNSYGARDFFTPPPQKAGWSEPPQIDKGHFAQPWEQKAGWSEPPQIDKYRFAEPWQQKPMPPRPEVDFSPYKFQVPGQKPYWR